jgi:polysaccharide pyruvyl transferase CsaB
MARIVISGYYGFANAGDEAMLTAMIEAFGALEPDIEITVLSGNPLRTRQQHGVKAIHRLNYPEIVATLRDADLLISGGGSLLQDVTSDRSFYYYLSIVMLAKKMKIPVMLYAQGIGPVQGNLARNAMRVIGNMVDLITVRDEGSREELKSLRIVKPPVYVTADPVLALMPMDRAVGRMLLARSGVEKSSRPCIGISVREWQGWGHYKKVIAEVADQLVSKWDAQIVYVPMQWPEDSAAAQEVAARSRSRSIILDQSYTTSELLAVIGQMDVLVGIRLHALVFAAVMNVPLVGISYDPKIERFLQSLGLAATGTLKTITSEKLILQIEDALQNREQMQRSLDERMHSLRNDAFSNAELAMTLINRNAKSERLMSQSSKG